MGNLIILDQQPRIPFGTTMAFQSGSGIIQPGAGPTEFALQSLFNMVDAMSNIMGSGHAQPSIEPYFGPGFGAGDHGLHGNHNPHNNSANHHGHSDGHAGSHPGHATHGYSEMSFDDREFLHFVKDNYDKGLKLNQSWEPGLTASDLMKAAILWNGVYGDEQGRFDVSNLSHLEHRAQGFIDAFRLKNDHLGPDINLGKGDIDNALSDYEEKSGVANPRFLQFLDDNYAKFKSSPFTGITKSALRSAALEWNQNFGQQLGEVETQGEAFDKDYDRLVNIADNGEILPNIDPIWDMNVTQKDLKKFLAMTPYEERRYREF